MYMLYLIIGDLIIFVIIIKIFLDTIIYHPLIYTIHAAQLIKHNIYILFFAINIVNIYHIIIFMIIN
jgi:hypothetical protein